MDAELLDICVSTYEDSTDLNIGVCIECNHMEENINTDSQKLVCPKCHQETMLGLTAIIQRFHV